MLVTVLETSTNGKETVSHLRRGENEGELVGLGGKRTQEVTQWHSGLG